MMFPAKSISIWKKVNYAWYRIIRITISILIFNKFAINADMVVKIPAI